jgi:hypothetical protein
MRLGALLLKNPEIALEAKRLAKKADPTLQIPEVDIDDRIAAAAKESQKSVEKLENELVAERVARRKTERDAQITAAGFKVDDIEKIIVDRKCTYETALHIAELERRTSEPTTADNNFSNPPGTPIEMRPEKTWRGLFGGALRQKSADLAHDMVNQFRNTRRAGAR